MIKESELKDLYILTNMTQKEIGKLYGCSHRTIGNYLNKYGIPKKRKGYKTKELWLDISTLKGMINQGMTIKEVTERHNLSRSAVYKMTKTAGVNFMNHVGQTARQSERMKTDNPLHNKEVKEIALKNSLETRNGNYKEFYRIFVDMDFKEYARKARAIAYGHYGRGINSKDGYEIDHKYSVKDGYTNRIPLMTISHPYNLRVVTIDKNKTKHDNSIITIENLLQNAKMKTLS